MKILIVDDNEQIRSAIKDILASPNMDFIECDDGLHALDIYRKLQPAWVLMDIMMPGINGFRATKDITTKYSNARVVIVTNYDDKEFREAAKQAGAVSFILKEELVKLREVCTNEG